LIQSLTNIFRASTLCVATLLFFIAARANNKFQDTTRPVKSADTLKFPLQDRRGDKVSNAGKNAFDLKDPSNISDSIEYDPVTKHYNIVERIGNFYYRKPTYLTFDEYMRIVAAKQDADYFKKRSNILSGLNKKMLKPKLSVTDNLFNRIFGNGKVEIRPQGNVDITAGYEGQNIKNPTLPERARKNGNFDFNMDANLSVIANIGDKLKLPINYNTLATFDFENQLKLDYSGTDDEIIKRIEAGNVSFTSKGSLIPGAQSLFGLKTQLQFGKLFVTGVLANQRAQRQSLGLQGGSATSIFEFRADDYEENRHFLLSQYFRQNYNTAMGSLPAVNSRVQILRLEVWVTNRNGSTTDTRDIVALMDLGEKTPYQQPPVINPQTNLEYPFNDANDLYRKIINDPNSRNSSFVTTKLSSLGLRPVQDFEKTFARKLYPSDYYFNAQIGFVSLNQPLQSDEILGVAYQYSYNGKIYQVGEFSQDVSPDTTNVQSGNQKVIFLKLLKATSQRPNLPIWDLMMKNVYALKTTDNSYLSSIQPTDFKLNVLYEEPSLGQKRYLPEGPKSGVPLISILNLDRLNNQRDPQPDGVFDYIEGFTVISNQARIIFPLLEPFGKDLENIAFVGATTDIKNKYVYYPLYDTIKEIAKTYAYLDRFIISGTAKGQSTSDISLGAFNVPQGSVTVTAGGRALVEGVDYTVDYNLGTVKVINQAITNSGVPVNVQFENNAGIGIQQRNFLGLRLDYLAKNTAKESLSFGGSIVKLGERPFFTKINYNEDPIRNTMYGADFSYRSEFPTLTRLLDKLPFYNTNEMSTITAYGEAAVLKPGHPPQIGKGSNGLVYIDDFEGTRNSIDVRFPLISWSLASTPQNNGLFPEGSYSDSLPYGYNRSKIAWYNIEPNLQDYRGTNNPVRDLGVPYFTDPRIHGLNQQKLFPAKTPEFGQAQLVTFDLAYYPTDKGPYNYDARLGSVDANGKLLNPKKRWGGIMRALDQVDFETGNVEFIEFWMLDPFLTNPNSSGGQLYFNLGNISEDVLRDGRRFFENGLPTPNIQAGVDSTTRWGKVPSNPIQVTQAFSNDATDRPYQDVGFDGLDDNGEVVKFQDYLNQLRTNFGVNSKVYQDALKDPSNDNFKNYRDADYDNQRAGILQRYKNINSPQGNSPIAASNSTITTAFTLYPDQEDLNRDNTLNELEEYFQYKVDLVPAKLQVGQNFITDIQNFTADVPGSKPEKWYLFRIPIAEYEQKVGNIPDFKSIRFMRMFMTNFEDSAVCRFAKLELVRNQWRRFTFLVDTLGTYKPIPANTQTTFNILAVNLEENSKRRPIPYIIPPDIERVQQLSNNNVNLLLNEQSLSMQICSLASQDTRGVFKTLNLDLRQYGRLQMFIHAESVAGSTTLKNRDLNAVIRIGNDFISNFYEIKIPLRITGTTADQFKDSIVWPKSNELDLNLVRLTQLKVKRNNVVSPNTYYHETDADGKTYAIIGNPNLGEVRGLFMGIQNTTIESICTEAWFNELRLSSIDEKGGYAALARVDMKLADLGTVSFSGNIKSRGFGTIEQRVNERSREDFSQFDLAANLEMGKLLPRKAGISIPVYAAVSQTMATPEYDPYDMDIKLKDKISAAPARQRDSIRKDAIDILNTTTINFTNVKKVNTTGKKQKIWSLENIDVSYSYTKTQHQNPLIENEEVIRQRGGLGYMYASTPKFVEPFKKVIRSKSPWYGLVRDLNFNPSPTLMSFRADVNRQFGAFRARNVGGPKGTIPETFDKYFTFDRYYNFRWDLTRSLNFDYTATNRARVDEDTGRLDRIGKARLRDNFFKGGRNTTFDQNVNVSYVLPTAKLPLLDWTNIRVSYIARFNWLAASLDPLAKSLGNFLSNGQERNATGEFDFVKLYRNSRWLRAMDFDAAPPPPPTEAGPPVAKTDSTTKGKKKKRDPNTLPDLPGYVKAIGRLLTSVKRVSVNYAETGTTNLAGYLDSTQFLGMNFRSYSPGWNFILGGQPDTAAINKFAQKGKFTKNPLFNTLNRQDHNQKLSIHASLIPVRDLTIDLNVDKTFGKSYSELFKDTIGSATSNLVRLNPYTAGSFNVSFISFQTMFEKYSPNEVSGTFKQFEANRVILSDRLGKANTYSKGIGADGYAQGYGRYAQDVLIPAFISAYTKQDPNSVSLLKQNNPNIRANPFSGIKPRPNWRVTYTGLSRIPGFEKIFSNVSLSHAYTSNLSMNSFNSALLFEDPLLLGQPGFIDTISGNFVPYFLIPNISIDENFAPFIDLDMTLTNQLTARFEYKKSRRLSLSLVDFQLSESRSTEFVIGGGWRKRGFKLPFKVPFTKKDTKKLENDINFRLDLSVRDDAVSNSRLDQDAALPTSGQKIISISPSIDYVLNNRVNVKLYFDQRRVEPKISTSAPITTTRAGVQIRISLAQ